MGIAFSHVRAPAGQIKEAHANGYGSNIEQFRMLVNNFVSHTKLGWVLFYVNISV